MSAKTNKGITRIAAGIIIAVISAGASVTVAKVTASTQAEKSLNEFKLDTSENFGSDRSRLSGLEATNSAIKGHLENIDGAIQSLTSKLLNEK